MNITKLPLPLYIMITVDLYLNSVKELIVYDIFN